MPRELRSLVAVEVAVIVAASLVSAPVPIAVPLLIVASVSLWVRGRSWSDVVTGPPIHALVGAAAGLVALVLGLLVATPLVETVTSAAVQWSMYPVARGSGAQALVVTIVIGVGALASELVLRGWVVERVLELGRPGAPTCVLAILVGATAEAMLSDGDFASRVGAGMFGAGLGWMYVAGGRSVVAPLCARLVFSVGAVTLEALRVIG